MLLVSIAKKISYLLATFIIIAAVFVSVSYLLAPLLDKHRHDFEKWASDLLQTPVTISKVEVSWYRYQPEISLNAVTLLNKETKEPILQIQKVRVFFSIPKSIWQRTFIPSGLMISGADINLHQSATGEISVQGFPALGGFNNQPYQRETKVTDLVGWLYIQPHIILQNINVRYMGFNRKQRFVTLYKLSFQNAGSHHVLLGKALLHQEIPTEINLAMQWAGNSTDINKIRSRIYLYVSGLSLGQWLKDYSWSHWQITKGIGSAKIWATWRDGKFTKVQSTFQVYGLNLYSETDKHTHKITRISGNAGLKREGNTYTIASDDLLIDLPTHLWPVNSFYISLIPDAQGALVPKIFNLGYIDLEDAQSFLFSSSWLTPAMRETLAKLQFKGSVQGINMLFNGAWDDYRHISFNGNFSQLGFAPWKKYPGMRNLSGKIKWDGTQGELSLDSHRAEFQYDSFFTHPISIDLVSGDAQFAIDQNNAWTVAIPSMRAMTNDTACNVSGKLSMQPDAAPFVDMNANFTMEKVNNLSRYLPSKILDPDLNKWLKAAFLAGEIKSANLVVKGPLNDFPFDQGNGTFSVSGIIQNMTLHYAPDWPDIEHMNAKVNFSGRQMTADVDQADIYTIPIGPVHAEIPYLGNAKPQVLNTQSNSINVDLAQGFRFLHHTPLEQTIGKMFAGVEMQGPATLKLGLIVPLNDPVKTQVQADLDIHDGRMTIPWGLSLTDMKGVLHFTESIAEAKTIQGQLFNKPFDLNLATIQKTKDVSVLRATLKNNLSVADLEKWLKVPLSKVAHGATDATIEADFSEKEPVTIHLNSNLVGIRLDLPDQYAKKTEDARDFSAEIFLPENEPVRARVVYGNLLSTALTLNRKKDEFKLLGVNLRLGTGVAAWPQGEGLYITGEYDELDWDKIMSYANQSDKSNGALGVGGLALREIDLNTKVLNVMGQRLTDVELQAAPSREDWKIKISSEDVIGDIQAPAHFTRQGNINAQFQRLRLRSSTNSNQSTKINFKTLPTVSLVANNVSYDDMPMGRVTLRLTPGDGGMNVQTFRIDSPRMNLQTSGFTQADETQLRGVVQSTQLGALLSSFGLNANNFIAKNGGINFELDWHDSLFAPSLASLNGRARMTIGPGRVVNVGEAGGAKMDLGRMLSIFSLQSIPRRLSFDFSDVFQKGYSFDSVQGDFNLQSGNAYTNNLRFNGPLAGVNINGRIGFESKDYDLVISITPFVGTVTSGLPVAAAVLTGPIGGVAALAVNTVLSPAVSKAATYHYSVRGPWNNPRWMSVSGASR